MKTIPCFIKGQLKYNKRMDIFRIKAVGNQIPSAPP